MTAQVPDTLIIESPAIDFPGMYLYGVIVGDIDDPKTWSGYRFSNHGSKAKQTRCTALWKGYVSVYRLTNEGRLVLERFEYPFTPGASPDEVHEVAEGEFWLDLRNSFFGDGVRVPFADGVVQLKRSLWRARSGVP